MDPGEVETAASYLARCLMADRGFTTATFPEARPLVQACDQVLTATDGMTVTIACIVDRDLQPERRFGLDAAQVDAIGRACRVHAGTLFGSRMPVSVEIWEVGAGAPAEADRQRLAALTFRRIAKGGAEIRTFWVDSLSGELFSTTAAADHVRRQAWVRPLIIGPRRSAVALVPHPIATFTRGRPVVTVGLIAALIAVFVVEVMASPATTGALDPPLDVLIGLGALDHGLFADGEAWRGLTAVFLHGGLLHIVFNCIALLMAGSVLEKLVGRLWTLGLFVIGGVGGAAGSLLLNAASVASVGASGAIMGLIAADLVIVLRLPKGQGRSAIMASLLQILIPALLPFLDGGENVDYGAHAGGAVAGALAGALLVWTWPARSPSPRGRILAGLLVAAAGLALAIGAASLAGDWDRRRADLAELTLLAPEDDLARLRAADTKQTDVDALVARFPRDPRARLYAAVAAVRADAYSEAQVHLEAALADPSMLRHGGPQMEVVLRATLAAIHIDLQRPDEARTTFAPVCAASMPAGYGEDFVALLKELCAPPP